MALTALSAGVRITQVTVHAPNSDGLVRVEVEAEKAVGFGSQRLGGVEVTDDTVRTGAEAAWNVMISDINDEAA